MTEQIPTPTREQVQQWLNHLTDDFLLAACAAEWGWQQRDASVADELQEARDEELEECCEWLRQFKPEGYVLAGRLRHRRFKPKSRKQRALVALTQMESQLDAELAIEIRQALEELPDD